LRLIYIVVTGMLPVAYITHTPMPDIVLHISVNVRHTFPRDVYRVKMDNNTNNIKKSYTSMVTRRDALYRIRDNVLLRAYTTLYVFNALRLGTYRVTPFVGYGLFCITCNL
jgi:hypothetical protein